MAEKFVVTQRSLIHLTLNIDQLTNLAQIKISFPL